MNVLWKSRLQLFSFAVFFVFLTSITAVVHFVMPATAQLDDAESALWAATTAGRFSIAWRSAIFGSLEALFPTLLVYWATRDFAKDETLARLNPKRTAIVSWLVMSACGVVGALAFWFRVHPLQNL